MTAATPDNSGRAVLIRTVVSLVIVVLGVWALFHVNPTDAYLWVKALHVIAVISWMAGMLYLPRLFVYHCSAQPGSVTSETFKVMEKRLLRFIINPAMVVTWITGLWMAWEIFGFQGGWLHAKLLLVVLMSGVHGYLSKSTRIFAEDRNMSLAKHWRIINEVPTVLMILIVILAIVKPF
ncbi:MULTISPECIES: protoporphyrinogen oxidase HemJ [Brucella]|uniref:Protoporphyrinogen IX oxidase n=1 Tax=Brucella ceti M644/93/1 TaxID=520459 RepID=A0ABM9ZCS2_9HYPH|nr:MULTISPECIES: protoporphyrinogen oxidase HemJ [Brucella]AHA98680.1 cytochrome functioning/assembly related protein [Brucella ceti TE10759-12]AHB01292.1 cytochrome functioning/assembly related protein [Brucella ceti TE28753-12]EEX89541.1 integral membrane protein [Brucella ceti M13/05/1]EEX97452.1 integral membrane protein [Brucella ceti M644/93/1]ENR09392.1 TIGR00701 family protein [Brucella sp. UK38/05]